MAAVKKENNFIYLFAGLLFYLVASPVIDQLWPWKNFQPQGIIFAVTLLVALFGIDADRRLLVAGIVLLLTALVASGFTVKSGDDVWDFISFGAALIFLVLAIYIAGKQVFRIRKPTINQLVGAICIYLLVGIIWSMLYALLYALSPASFSNTVIDPSIENAREWLYFSFVTLTTLGYGDITPASPVARALAYFEAIVGQFYIAILVAGLVGAYLSDRRSVDR